jgi:nitrate/TMAO reductase-like tetraheme cytochrome c subunit
MDDPATDPGPAPDGAATASGGVAAEEAATDGEPGLAPDGAVEPAPVRRRPRFYLRGRRLRLPSSRRGLFALLMVLSGLGLVAVFSTVSLIHWTETADFCGRCHTMAPELKAYEAGPHADVTCGECHVSPGVAGWVKSKVAGTRQLVQVVLGTFPTPIHAPDHGELPAAQDTCMKCHDVEREELADVRTRAAFSEDEDNSRQFVGLMIRPGGGDVFDIDRGVHWHVTRDLDYWSEEVNGATIDYVEAAQPDGSVKRYIAQDRITDASYVEPDIDVIKAGEPSAMTCYDCHNRTGHSVANPREGLDYQLSTGGIDATLPFIKREGMRILWSSFPDVATADAEADKLRDFYADNYPEVAATKGAQINAAIDEIKVLYRLSATPEMQVTAKTYADNIGHTDFPGCFRCHDGGHFEVGADGVALKNPIPSTCDTCHTFPQIGPAVASLPLGEPPATHDDDLWVFNHKNVATDLDPGGQDCGECHARDYCVNCHATGAVTVDHDTMATNHAQVIRDQGNQACAYCHQPVYCARCHAEPVLPITTPFSQGPSSEAAPHPEGLSWPLEPHGGG